MNFGVEEVSGFAVEHEYAALLRAAEANLVECLRLFAGQPGVEFVDDERGVLFLNRNSPPDSMVLRLRSASDAAALVTELESHVAELESLAAPVDFVVFPARDARSVEIALRQRGLAQGRSAWMLAELGALPAPPPLLADFRVEVATSLSQLAEWARASAVGFGYDTASEQRYLAAYAAPPVNAAVRRLHHVGSFRDEPVCSSTLLFAAGISGVYDVSTAPAQRGKGYATQLLRVILEDAQRRGYAHAALLSSPLGASTYRKAGFGFEFDVPEYRWAPAALSTTPRS